MRPADAEEVKGFTLPVADAPAGRERGGKIGERLIRITEIYVGPRPPSSRHGLPVVVAERAHRFRGIRTVGDGPLVVAEHAVRKAPAVERDGSLVRLV